MSAIRVLILGTGGMANTHAEAYAEIDGVEVVAGVDVSAENLKAFCKTHNVAHGFSSLDAALDWGAFDAVSNVTPDALHHRTTLPLLAAGKHVLCEKPLATNAKDAAEMAQAAATADVVNMVNLTYRRGGALEHAAEMVARGEIGDVRHFEASYLQSWLTQPAWGDWATEDQWLWRLSTAHGSLGVLGDVGVHIIDFATYVAGASVAQVSCRLNTFDKAPDGRIGDYVLDANDSFSMHARLTNGASGVIHASRFASGHLNDLSLRVYGTKGGLEVQDKMHQSRLRGSIGDDMKKGHWIDIEFAQVQSNFERFIDAIRGNQAGRPDFARGAELQNILDCAVQSDADGCKDKAI